MKIIDRLGALDELVLGAFDKTVTFLHDWLFLSQKWVERGVLILYGLSCAGCFYYVTIQYKHSYRLWYWEILWDVLVGWNMWAEHRQPRVQRTIRRASEAMIRSIWAIGMVIALPFPGVAVLVRRGASGYDGYAVWSLAWAIFRFTMLYVTVLDVEGERGRAAKLSWEKIKQLFGTSWVPDSAATIQ